MQRLRILSYNIHKGFSGNIRKYTLGQMRDQIRKIHPDLIFLQEVHGHHSGHQKNIRKWPDGSQFEFLAENLWPHFTYGKNAIYTKGHHGNAILSKFPILYWENIDISENRFEKRGLLHTIIQISKKHPPLHAVCTHLGLFENDRKKQLDQLSHRIKKIVPNNDLLVVAGDFNDWRGKASVPLIKRTGLKEAFMECHGRYAKTFPAFFPFLTLDRIYFRGFDVLSAHCLSEPPWDSLSDHAPLNVELRVQLKNEI